MVIDDVFAVIAEATRREILVALQPGDRAVGELVEELGVSQPTVSKHLKVLRDAGLVSMRADGQKRFYALRLEPLGAVATWLHGFELAAADLDARTPADGDVTYDGMRPPAVTSATGMAQSDQFADDSMPQQISRSVGRAAGKAADLFANLPKLRRRRD